MRTAAAIAAETVRLRRDLLFPPRVLVVEGAGVSARKRPTGGVPDAMRRLGTGRTRGKQLIVID